MLPDAVPPTPVQLEEVVVTARRIEESLQRVPVAVTAITPEQLAQSQIVDLQQAQYLAPSLVIWPLFANPMSATISLRGQTEVDLVPTYDQSVGVYLDGVYIARSTGANLGLVDVQRVEILRGPQGTLFGRNTLGGAINIISQPPVHRTEGSIEVRLGDYSRQDVTGVLNVPLNDEVAVRAAVQHTQHAGYGHDVVLDRDLGDDDTTYARLQARYDPGAAWSGTMAFDVSKSTTGSQLTVLRAAFPPATDVPAAAGHPDDNLERYIDPPPDAVQSNRAGRFDARVWGLAAELDRAGSSVSFKSISAYRELDLLATNYDWDGTPYDIAATRKRDQHEWQFSQELQWHAKTPAQQFDWTAGAIYFVESAELYGHSIDEYPLQTIEPLLRGTANNSSWAAYAQGELHLGQSTRLTAGLRYNVDRRQLISRNAYVENDVVTCRLVPELLDTPGVCRATLPQREYHYVPFTLGIDHTGPGDSLWYAKVSTGERAGGYNMRGGTGLDLLTFDPETVYSYELGMKADVLNDHLRTNLAVYRSDYQSMQLAKVVSNPAYGTAVVKLNAGDARIDGLELEAVALLGPVRLAGSLGITEGRYVHLDPNIAWLTLHTPFALPRTTYSISADWLIQVTAGTLDLHADYAWRSDDAGLAQRCDCNNAYGLINVTASLELGAPHVNVALWARNVAGEHYMAQWLDAGDFIDAVPGEPRTVGISARYAFGEP